MGAMQKSKKWKHMVSKEAVTASFVIAMIMVWNNVNILPEINSVSGVLKLLISMRINAPRTAYFICT